MDLLHKNSPKYHWCEVGTRHICH